MPLPRQVFVAVIGAGGVGKCFLSQLSALAQSLSQSPSAPTYLSLIYLSTSKKALLHADYKSQQLSSWESELKASSTAPLPPPQLADYLVKAPGKVVLVDNTSNQEVADSYPLFLKKGISIVTPNKKAFSGSYKLWEDIFHVASNGTGANGLGAGGYVFHESSVGAGLPVIVTLKDLIRTGDEICKIEGVFSGTMSFLFNSFQPTNGGGGKFSAEVKKAKELGYTEPDPRDDLNGLDVARKLTILARIAGLKVESPTSFPVQSLIPKELESASSGDEFLSRLPEFDGQMDQLKADAEKEDKVVRFVGSIDVQKGDVKVGLEKFDKSHPIAALKGSDNIIAFYTKRYGDNPLIIQGAGAGGEVTAMGVTGDLLRVLRLIR
ncbi:Homoserine dehydrogenase [Paraconiothyrium brasiliense]|uniref:Homoserine dehydrogenase n=1 Tax=Paraconiothyrium brasiliense TaxID=300254 RepID=A0ABR3S193_9PLEO